MWKTVPKPPKSVFRRPNCGNWVFGFWILRSVPFCSVFRKPISKIFFGFRTPLAYSCLNNVSNGLSVKTILNWYCNIEWYRSQGKTTLTEQRQYFVDGRGSWQSKRDAKIFGVGCVEKGVGIVLFGGKKLYVAAKSNTAPLAVTLHCTVLLQPTYVKNTVHYTIQHHTYIEHTATTGSEPGNAKSIEWVTIITQYAVYYIWLNWLLKILVVLRWCSNKSDGNLLNFQHKISVTGFLIIIFYTSNNLNT